MIEKLTVVNANYSGMQRYFPDGHELDTSSGLVLLVGPIGSGKTGLMKMIATSIRFGQYFKKNGISRWWNDYRFSDLEPIFRSDITRRDVYEYSLHDERISSLAFDRRNKGIMDGSPRESYDDTLKIVKEEDWNAQNKFWNQPELKGWFPWPADTSVQQSLINDPRFGFRERDFKVYQASGYIAIKALPKLDRVRQALSEDTALNRWGYLILQTSGRRIYTQGVPPPINLNDGDDWQNGRKEYLQFVHTYDGRNEWFSPDLHKTPGQMTLSRAEQALEDIVNFFEQGITPVFTPIVSSPWGRIERMSNPPETHESVRKGSQLVVFIDDPTGFLDYRQKYALRDRIMELIERYSPRLQIFMATQDAVLIERTEGCKFISLDQRPAKSSTHPPKLRQPKKLRGKL